MEEDNYNENEVLGRNFYLYFKVYFKNKCYNVYTFIYNFKI